MIDFNYKYMMLSDLSVPSASDSFPGFLLIFVKFRVRLGFDGSDGAGVTLFLLFLSEFLAIKLSSFDFVMLLRLCLIIIFKLKGKLFINLVSLIYNH